MGQEGGGGAQSLLKTRLRLGSWSTTKAGTRPGGKDWDGSCSGWPPATPDMIFPGSGAGAKVISPEKQFEFSPKVADFV